jgi:hypothetical protein
VSEVGFKVEVTDYSKGDLLEDNDRRMADIFPPIISISVKPNTITNSNAAVFEFSTDDNKAILYYSFDGGELIALEPPSEEVLAEFGDEPYVYTVDFSGLSEKQYHFIITATDEANNTSIQDYTWTTDYTAPVALIPTYPAAIANTSSFGLDATDTNKPAGITYEYKIGTDGTWTAIDGSSLSSIADLAQGSNTIYVRAKDAAENVGATTTDIASYNWIYDTVAPVASIPTTPDSRTPDPNDNIANTSSFVFDATDTNKSAGIIYQYSLDGVNWNSTTAALNLSLPATEGTNYTINVKATDKAGNTSTEVPYTWTYDTIAPTVALSASPDALGATVTAYYNNPYEPGTVSYAYDVPNTGLSDGVCTLTVTATDQAGNVSSTPFTFTLDISTLTGNVAGTGSEISGAATGSAVAVEGQDWGGWKNNMTGDWTGTHTGSLSLTAGGSGYGGYGGYGFWLSLVSGSLNTGTGAATGTSDITLLTLTSISEGAGSFTGSFLTDYTWTGTETSTGLTNTPLDFGGEYNSSLLYNDYGLIEWSGGLEGLFGLVDNEDRTYNFLAIGGYSDDGNGEIEGGYGGPYVWSGSLYGDQVTSSNGYGGAEGFTAGSWKKAYAEDSSGDMNGNAAVIYYTETGEVGLLSGDILGDFYEMYESGYGGMFLTEGALTATLMDPPDGYNPSTAGVSYDWLYADLAGIFGDSDTNTIFGTSYGDSGKTKFITYYDSTDYYYKSLPWGIYNLKLGGYDYDHGYYWDKPAGDIAWSAKVGGKGYFGYNYGDDYGYWLADIGSLWDEIAPYNYDGYGGYGYGTIDGSLLGTYLTGTHMGTISGPFYGLYTEDGYETGYGGYGSWVGVSAGTYVEDKALDYSGYWGGDSLHRYSQDVGEDGGLIGLIQSATVANQYDYLAMGEYDGDPYGIDYGMMYGYMPYIWASNLYTESETVGFSGGIWSNGEMDGKAIAILDTQNSSAGILIGDVSGNFYETWSEYNENHGGVWMAEGTLDYIEMSTGSDGNTVFDPMSPNGYGMFDDANGYIYTYYMDGSGGGFEDQLWGIWGMAGYGAYYPTTSDNWAFSMTDDNPDPDDQTDTWIEVVGNKWSDGEIAGKVAGAWIDIEGVTGVMGGELKGTFDPSNYLWQAVTAGSWIETTKFLDMVKNNPAALEALNIPCIEIGKTTLSGESADIMTVNMNDVTFFAYSNGADPRIWATGNVNGTFSLTPVPGTTSVPLTNTSESISAAFGVTKWDSNIWGATVQGGGTLVRTDITGTTEVYIEGGAAGTYSDIAGAFSGTGAGVVKPYEP